MDIPKLIRELVREEVAAQLAAQTTPPPQTGTGPPTDLAPLTARVSAIERTLGLPEDPHDEP